MQVSNVKAELVDDVVIASYELIEDWGKSIITNHHIRPINLALFIDDTEMAGDSSSTLYLVRNLQQVVEAYLEFNFMIV